MENVNTPELPGVFIREELEARCWTQGDLAYILGIAEPSLNRIIAGKTGISVAMAKALGEAFAVSAEFFANLQNAYDLAHVSSPDPAVSTRGRIQKHYPLREMIKRGWLEKTDPVMLEAQLSRFFEVSSFEKVPHMDIAARRTNQYDAIESHQLAWLFRVKQIAKTMIVPRFSIKALRATLEKLTDMRSEPEEIRHIPRLLNDAGIRFVVVEGLKGCKIDGVCFWLNNSPAIGMSLRFDRIDNFWFVLRHELEHVLLKHGKGEGNEIIDVDIVALSNDNNIKEEERLANQAAADFCVRQDMLRDFISRKKPFFSERDTLAFARRMDTHPGIIVGQIQHNTKRYDFLRRHQVDIREYLSLSMDMDGWGNVAHVEL